MALGKVGVIMFQQCLKKCALKPSGPPILVDFKLNSTVLISSSVTLWIEECAFRLIIEGRLVCRIEPS